ncbi:hypothetical protein HanPSC8_Chr10g0413541 [Helianthus annuus]|nr:hypothetical protein HanPSC8_Chr10g0413541 [Helianthus annuus]
MFFRRRNARRVQILVITVKEKVDDIILYKKININRCYTIPVPMFFKLYLFGSPRQRIKIVNYILLVRIELLSNCR